MQLINEMEIGECDVLQKPNWLTDYSLDLSD